MPGNVTRRSVLRGVSSAFAASATLELRRGRAAADHDKKDRLAIVGVGNRGTSLLKTLLNLEGIEVNALSDIRHEVLKDTNISFTQALAQLTRSAHFGKDLHGSAAAAFNEVGR